MNSTSRFTPGRYLQALAVGKNRIDLALAYVQSQPKPWHDHPQLIPAIQALAEAYETDDFPSAHLPIADAFLEAMRHSSVPLRLMSNLRRVPMYTRIFRSTGTVIAAEVLEGRGIPVMAGTWESTTLRPRKFAGIVVKTDELMQSPNAVASAAITDELSAAVADGENYAFVNPGVTGSVLNGASNFAGTGAAVANVDADLERLVDLVPGAHLPGAAFVMTQQTATYLSLLRGSGGAAAYPLITPQGGFLIGLPVYITTAANMIGSPTAQLIGLIVPSEIFFADEGRVVLTTSRDAALQMLASPTQLSTGATAASTLVSMMQVSSVALKAVRQSAWYARSNAGAYFTCAY